MSKRYHILNGDSLKERFPEVIDGTIIVARECLVDGDLYGKDLPEFFQTRASFISNHYEGYSKEDYYNNTLPEFEKIRSIEESSEANLWFEDDLFCQANLWFVLYLLQQKDVDIFLIRPQKHTQYGFAALNDEELQTVFKQRPKLLEIKKLAKLWAYYRNNETAKLLALAREFSHSYPFILNAVKAHIERIPTKEQLGKPSKVLKQIMVELGTDKFGPVFQEFCKREPIYGFGDLQVKRLYDAIIKND